MEVSAVTRITPQQDNKDRIGSVLVVGAGIGGMQASLDLANSGLMVHLINDEPSIGGTMSRLDKTFPTGDCAMCMISPRMVESSRHPNIKMHTMARVTEGFRRGRKLYRYSRTESPLCRSRALYRMRCL